MKTLFAIFVLFAAIAGSAPSVSWMDLWRRRCDRNANDALAVVENTSSGFPDFHELLDENVRNRRSVFAINPGRRRRRTEYKASEVHRLLSYMDATVMHASFVYFAQHVIEYYLIAGRYPGDLIGSNGCSGFAVFTAWYDRRTVVVDEELESILCSIFLVPNARAANDNLIWKLIAYKNDYKKTVVIAEDGPSPRRRRPNLPEVEKVLLDFPDAFCARWKPMAGDVLFSDRRKTDRPNRYKSVFVRRVFEKEKCVVHLGTHGYTTWICTGILDRREYRLKKCKEKVIKTTTEHGGRLRKTHRSLTNAETMRNEEIAFSFSLVELEHEIAKDYGDYYNAVNYYNIASDVILLVSIREGGELLRGIRHVVTGSCAENDVRVDEILALRSALSAFRSVLDRLVAVMSDEKRIDVGRNPYKTKFDGLVNEVLKLLRVRDGGVSITEMCTGVPEVLNGEKYEVRLDDSNAHNTVEFREFYSTLPLLHVNQLYLFYAHDFV